VAALTILVWNVYASSRWATRPTTLEQGALQTSRINLNQADRVQLMQLHGVGETLATRIIAYRDEHHGLRNVDELRNVHGIGPALIEKLRPCVYVEAADDEDETEPPDLVMPNPPPQKQKQDKPATSKKAEDLKGLIDINRASAEELQHLPRIGPKLAERIIEARHKAPFKKIDDLRRVSGIGAKTLDGLRPFVTVGEAEAEKKE
jgi:competence protein ComEA